MRADFVEFDIIDGNGVVKLSFLIRCVVKVG